MDERALDAVIVIILILALFIPAATLFFLDGGEIKGFETPNKSSELKLNQPVTIDGLTIEIISEKIEPIDDGTEIIQIEFWQLTPRQMIIQIITYPMAYIPLSTGKLLSYIYLASGLAFVILYYKISGKKRSPDSRREQIYQYIGKNPGKSLQQIADAMQLSRSSLKYHLNRLQDSDEIHQKMHGEYPRYFPSHKGISDKEKVLFSLISEEKDHLFFQTLLTHPGITRKKLAATLEISEATVSWHLSRLENYELFTTEKIGREVQYTLTPETVAAYHKIVTEELTEQDAAQT
ncbi:winged helix-turn-helix transcriptional regulator [Methanorbis rubei]